MEKLILKLNDRECIIKIGQNIFENLKDIIRDRNCFFVIDKFVYEKFYDKYFKGCFETIVPIENIYLLESDERNKEINIALKIVDRLIKRNFLRDSILIGIGGGIIGDIVGFVSSIYMRGIEFINIPTTLLSQVDSSIGGKNALNFFNYKNLIGTFNHPKEVIIDIKFLETLPKRELICGLAEIIKYGIILDYNLLEYINDNLEKILSFDKKIIENLIIKSCSFKIGIVSEDEKDFRIRKILNHGHTVGHAIEGLTSYSCYNHGEAVFIGMFYETCIAYELGLIDTEYFNSITNVLRKFKIDFDRNMFCSDDFYNILMKDKKNETEKISFILPVGKSKVLEYMFTIDEFKKIYYYKYCF